MTKVKIDFGERQTRDDATDSLRYAMQQAISDSERPAKPVTEKTRGTPVSGPPPDAPMWYMVTMGGDQFVVSAKIAQEYKKVGREMVPVIVMTQGAYDLMSQAALKNVRPAVEPDDLYDLACSFEPPTLFQPCPFCGGEPMVRTNSRGKFLIWCTECGIENRGLPSFEDVVRAWNGKPTSQPKEPERAEATRRQKPLDISAPIPKVNIK